MARIFDPDTWHIINGCPHLHDYTYQTTTNPSMSGNSSPQHDATSFSSPDFLILDSAALHMLTDAQNLDAPFKTNTSYHNTLTVTLKNTQSNAHQLAQYNASPIPNKYRWVTGSEDTWKLHTQTSTFLEALHQKLTIPN